MKNENSKNRRAQSKNPSICNSKSEKDWTTIPHHPTTFILNETLLTFSLLLFLFFIYFNSIFQIDFLKVFYLIKVGATKNNGLDLLALIHVNHVILIARHLLLHRKNGFYSYPYLFLTLLYLENLC